MTQIKAQSKQVVTSRVMTITPELAVRMIEASDAMVAQRLYRNRKLSQPNINKLARIIEAGDWKLNGMPIIITKSGLVADGQHRLWACIQTGIPIEVMVVEGVEDEVFPTLADGKPRSLPEIMECGGVVNSGRKASVCSVLWYWEQGRIANWGNSITNPSKPELLTIYFKYQSEIDQATEQTVPLRRLLESRIASFCWIMFGRKDPEYRDVFFERLNGINADPSMAAYWLRKRLEANQSSVSKLKGRHKMMYTIKAWNYRDQPVKWLRLAANEEFPEIR